MAFRTLSGGLNQARRTTTEFIADPPGAPYDEQVLIPGGSRVFSYTLRSPLATVPHIKVSHLSVISSASNNTTTEKVWNGETNAMAQEVAKADAASEAGFLKPEPEDYDRLFAYLQSGFQTNQRTPVIPPQN